MPTPATFSHPPEPLNALQLELLKLYSTEISREDLLEVKRVLARHFANKAIAGADEIWRERELSGEDMDAWLRE